MISLHSLVKNVDLSDEASVEEVCAKINAMDDKVTERLSAILSRQCQIDSKMHGIGRALSGLAIVQNDSTKLTDMIGHTAQLAENVSAKVRRLDEARSRVSECQQRVHDLIDLQLCAQGVTAAIREEEFETGAGHIHRYLSMDQTLLQQTADDVSGSIAQALATLDSATTQMRQIIAQKFDEAVKKDDLASVERFFKIYPLLRMYDEGIQRFCDYIGTKLQAKCGKELRTAMDVAKANKRLPVAYADTLTQLLENFARVVEVNQPIVENFYGHGHLGQMVIRLQTECDDLIKKLLNEFQKNRHIQHRIGQIKDQQMASGGGSSGIGGGSTSSGMSSTKGHFRKPSGGSVDKLNPKDIDGLLGEITVMHFRAELYVKFMRRKVTTDLENKMIEEEKRTAQTKLFEDALAKSDLSRKMQELLGVYLLFESYFMEESVLKAIALDTFEAGQQCSSMVDDVFFIIKKSIRRSTTTQSLDGICAVINNAASCLEGDFVAALRAPLKSGYPSGYIDLAAQAYNAFQTSIQQGKLQTSDTEQARADFIVQLNNADMSVEFVDTLCAQVGDEVRNAFPAITQRETQKLDSCLGGFRSVRDTLRGVVDFGLQQLRSSAVKPRLHTWIDQFVALRHELNDEELAAYEAGETFVQALIVQIDGLLTTFRATMSERNFDALVGILAVDVTARLEASVKKCAYNRLGGLVLDQEIRALGSYLTNATSWSVRDKMVRLTQIATLLNLEQVSEVSEYFNQSETNASSATPAWRFSAAEIRSILALRSDFRMEDIKRVKL